MVAANVGHDVEEVADDTALRRHKTEASPDEGIATTNELS